MSTSAVQNEFGYFGKLPAFGDFIHQILPQDFANGFHTWLQQSMASARAVLGDDFLTWYLNCPAWKFLLTPGVCGAQAVAGLTIPSVDRVGRYFNFTVATVLAPETHPVDYAMSNGPGFAKLETTALDILEADDNREGLELKVRDLAQHFDPITAATLESDENTDYMILSQDRAQMFSGQSAALLDGLLVRSMGDFSLWWTGTEGQDRSRLLVASGMPSGDAYLRFLTPGQASAVPEEAHLIDTIIAGEA